MALGGTMEIFISFASILGALLIGALSPGPSFVLVARTSITVSRADGLYMAIGMGIGGVIFSILFLAGLRTVLDSAPWLYTALKVVGGIYLIYLALEFWRGAKEPVVLSSNLDKLPNTALKSFLLALFTQLSNPKAVVIYGSIFAALLPKDMPLFAILLLPIFVFLVEAGWYAIVAFTLSTAPWTIIYLNSKASIDRVASVVMGGLGFKLLAEVN